MTHGDYQAFGSRTFDATGRFDGVLHVAHAQRGRLYNLRIRGAGYDYQLILEGGCGPEVYATGTVPSGPPVFTRLALPDTLAATDIRLAIKPAAAQTLVLAEITWQPIEPGAQPQPGQGCTSC